MSKRRSVMLRLLFSSLVLSAALGSSIVQAVNVTVFAAASLKEALDEQARVFEPRNGDKVVISYAASNALAKQIEAGAPADIFISADSTGWTIWTSASCSRPDTRVNLLRNTLVLVAPAVEQVDAQDRAEVRTRRARSAAKGWRWPIRTACPRASTARARLSALGVWAAVEKKVARADNVRAALALVSRGEAPFGIVYATDAIADKGVRIVDTFPADTHPPIVYPAALVRRASRPAARAAARLPAFARPRAPSGRSTGSAWRNSDVGLTPDELGIIALSLRVALSSVIVQPAARDTRRLRARARASSRARRSSTRSSTCRWCCLRSSSGSRCSCCSASAARSEACWTNGSASCSRFAGPARRSPRRSWAFR